MLATVLLYAHVCRLILLPPRHPKHNPQASSFFNRQPPAIIMIRPSFLLALSLVLLLARPDVLHAFVLPSSSLAIRTRSSQSSLRRMKLAGVEDAATSTTTTDSLPRRTSFLHTIRKTHNLATGTATLLIGSATGQLLSPALPAAQAADLTPLPAEFKTAVINMREAVFPINLRDAAKALSETPGLDELAFDDGSRRAINTELKELQAARPDLWDAETSYYGGVIRRAVNPFHVIELIPLLKVRFCLRAQREGT